MKNILTTILFFSFFNLNALNRIYEFKHLSTENGLAGNTIYCMAQDSLGYAWIGTSRGLSKYDGYSFSNYFINQDTLTENWTILDIAIDAKNNIIIATLKHGLWLYCNNCRHFKVIDSINTQNVKINKICIADSSSIYIATDKGIFFGKYSTNDNDYRIVPFRIKEHPSIFSKCVFVDSKRNLWISTTDNTIIRYPLNHKQKPTIYSHQLQNGYKSEVLDFEEDQNGTLWAGTWGSGLLYYNTVDNAWQQYNFSKIEGSDIVTDILSANDGSLYVSTWGGGVEILSNNRKLEHRWKYNPTNPNGLNSNRIWSLMQDKGGNIWVGTDYEGGVNIFDYSNSDLKRYRVSSRGMSNTNVCTQFGSDKQQNVYIAGNFGIKKFDKDLNLLHWYNILQNDNDEIIAFDIFLDLNYILYASKFEGVIAFNTLTKRKEKITLEGINNLSDIEIIKIIGNKYDNSAWIVTKKNGLFKYYFPKNKAIAKTHPLHINDIAIDSKGGLWLATKKYGLVQFHAFSDSYSIVETGFTKDKNVLIVTADDKDNIYFFDQLNGLLVYNTKSNTTTQCKQDDFPLKNITNLAVDSLGSIWATTPSAIYNIKLSEKSLLYKKVFNDIKNSFFAPYSITHINNTAYIGSDFGFYSFSPSMQNFKQKNNNLNVVFTNIAVNSESIAKKDNPIEYTKQVTLAHNENNIDFYFSSMKHESVEDIAYYYMLQGFDNTFTISKKGINKASYTNLPAGTYYFKVAVIDNDGIKPFNKITITVLSPYWKQLWFILICIVMLIIIVIKIIKIRENSLIKTNALLQEEIDKRIFEISEQHQNLRKKNKILEDQKQLLEEKYEEKLSKQMEIANQRTNLQEQKLSIELHHRRIVENIRYAKKIQEMVLQPQECIQDIFPQSFLFLKPRDVVGGDFFWAQQFNNKKIIAIADCTGHGVPGAFMSILGYSLLKEILRINKDKSAAFILNTLNAKIQKSLSQNFGSSRSQDGMDISFCIVDYDTKTLNFAGANNPLFLVRNKELHVIKADKIPIGFYYRKGEFSDHIIEFESNDMIYLFSDGYIDQFGGERNKKFKGSTFKRIITEINHFDPNFQLSILKSTLKKWMKLSPDYPTLDQTDDIIIFGAKL